jgi:hypothetical protein
VLALAGCGTAPATTAAPPAADAGTEAGPGDGAPAWVPEKCTRTPGVLQALGTTDDLSNGLNESGSVAVGPHSVYWIQPSTSVVLDADGEIRRTGKCGGAATRVSRGLAAPMDLVVVGDDAYWVELGTENGHGGLENGRVAGGPEGGAQGIYGPTSEEPAAIATDGARLFWAGSWGIYRIPVAGGTPDLVTDEHAAALVVDDVSVYFVDMKGDLKAVPKAGGSVRTVAKTACAFAVATASIAADAESLYWSDGCGSVLAARVLQ